MNITFAGTRSPVVKGSVGNTMPALAGTASNVAMNAISEGQAFLVQPWVAVALARRFRAVGIGILSLTAG
ncbi:hypothetical protein [Luteimonas changyuni]|uniref:hypothetical protein n=1 Tax=Luteimonas sp. MJ145 TaxID=3129234 RepID=UPI0031BA6DBC